jgi:hypothetical protein
MAAGLAAPQPSSTSAASTTNPNARLERSMQRDGTRAAVSRAGPRSTWGWDITTD